MLRSEDGSPCTTRKKAGRAADGMRKTFFADTLEETAHFVQEAKRLKTAVRDAPLERLGNLPQADHSS